MVNVSTGRYSNISRRAVQGRGAPKIVETSLSTTLNTELLDHSRIHIRKRSRCTLDGRHPRHSLGHGLVKGGVVENTGIRPRNDVPLTVWSGAIRTEVTDDTVGTAAKQTGNITSKVLLPVQDKHHFAGEVIKTEMELLVLL